MEKGKINSYRDLVVWQKSKAYAVRVYKVTKHFPHDELYGLVSQMRRAAVSVPSNIAEGFRRKSNPERVRFLRIAYGSEAELDTQLEISRDLRYITQEEYGSLARELEEIAKMTHGALKALDR